MGTRIFYLVVAAFFVTMNVLLWRADIAGRADFGSRLAPRLVWEKALTAAGESALEIRYKGAKIGTARFQPNIGEARPAGSEFDPDIPEGMIERVSNYLVEFDGHFTPEESLHFRFGFHLRLSTNYNWEEFSLRLALRPYLWEIHSTAADQKLELRIEDEHGHSNRTYKFTDLQDPGKILAEFHQPWLSGALLALGMPLTSRTAAQKSFGFKWQARNDSITVEHTHIRGYTLEAKLLDRHSIRIFINPAGEILRIELPGEVVLLNEALTTL